MVVGAGPKPAQRTEDRTSQAVSVQMLDLIQAVYSPKKVNCLQDTMLMGISPKLLPLAAYLSLGQGTVFCVGWPAVTAENRIQ